MGPPTLAPKSFSLSGCLGRGAILLGVQGVVAEIFVPGAVELLATAPGLDDELAGGGVSVLRVIVGAQDLTSLVISGDIPKSVCKLTIPD